MADRPSYKAADLAQMRAQLVALGDAIRVLADKETLTAKEEERFDLSLKEYENLKAEITLASNSAARSALRNDPNTTSSQGHDGPAPAQWRQSDRRAGWEYAGREPSQRVGNAMSGVETACEMVESMTGLRTDIAPSIRSTLEKHPRAADAIVARSDPAYVTAFSKLLAIGDPGRAFMSMTEDERNTAQVPTLSPASFITWTSTRFLLRSRPTCNIVPGLHWYRRF